MIIKAIIVMKCFLNSSLKKFYCSNIYFSQHWCDSTLVVHYIIWHRIHPLSSKLKLRVQTVPPGRVAKNRTVDLTCGRWSRSPLIFATPQQLGHTLKLRHIPLATPHHKATSHLFSTFMNSLHMSAYVQYQQLRS
jgi:hypothetical protein